MERNLRWQDCSSRFSWRWVIATALSLIGVWLLAGCFYLPIPEHRVGRKSTDFRPLVASGRKLPAIRPGIQRAAVIAMLGTPQYESQNCVGYRLYTEAGLWVWPLCFQATSATRTEYGVNLTFDENNALTHVESVNADASEAFFLRMIPRIEEHIPFDDLRK